MHFLANSVLAFSNASKLTEDNAFELHSTSIVPPIQTLKEKSSWYFEEKIFRIPWTVTHKWSSANFGHRGRKSRTIKTWLLNNFMHFDNSQLER